MLNYVRLERKQNLKNNLKNLPTEPVRLSSSLYDIRTKMTCWMSRSTSTSCWRWRSGYMNRMSCFIKFCFDPYFLSFTFLIRMSSLSGKESEHVQKDWYLVQVDGHQFQRCDVGLEWLWLELSKSILIIDHHLCSKISLSFLHTNDIFSSLINRFIVIHLNIKIGRISYETERDEWEQKLKRDEYLDIWQPKSKLKFFVGQCQVLHCT